ncbi:MAG: 30S ribosomal protein S17 [Candidatus Pacebacteria bacterium]|nr:30S ribosomal protein S17 [Candidatus Paceibacterota bacterium]
MATKKTTTKKEEPKKIGLHTVLDGVVVKAAMQKTVVVKVTRFVKHPKYQKYQTLTKKYKVHDEAGAAKVGDKVKIIETKPISKDKRFTLLAD